MSRSDVLVDAEWVQTHRTDPGVVIVEVDVSVVGVAAGGDAVSEQEAMTRQTAGPNRARRAPDILRPWYARISKPPLTSCNQERKAGSVRPRLVRSFSQLHDHETGCASGKVHSPVRIFSCGRYKRTR